MMPGRWARLSKREKTWAVLALLIVAVVAGDLLVARPLQNRVRELDEQIAKAERRVIRNEGLLVPALRQALENSDHGQGARLRKRSSTAEENSAMLAEVEALASRTGVNLTATRPREPRVEDYYEEYAVEVETESEFKNLLTFLYELEQSPQLLRAQRLAVDGTGGGEQGPLKGRILITKVVTL